jgi:cell fate (sporulation/competence/biofilm development) regulator YlbF (YheA/YmcA/DUF963 family)
MKNSIINTVKIHSYLIFEEGNSDDNRLEFVTRENGNVLEEKYSELDLNNAFNAEMHLKKLFGDKVKIIIEPVDEWVCMTVIF